MQGYPKASSVLGPLLLLININDVAEHMMSFCRLFADDNLIQHIHKKSERYQINSDRRPWAMFLDNWSNKWLLEFNPVKLRLHFSQ